jgi:capsular exopolysaccharide synthesis family protein
MSRIVKARLKASGRAIQIDPDEDFSVEEGGARIPVEPFAPGDRAPVSLFEAFELGEPVEPPEPVEEARPVQRFEPIESVKPVEPIVPVEPLEEEEFTERAPREPARTPTVAEVVRLKPVVKSAAEPSSPLRTLPEEQTVSFIEAGTLEEARLRGVLRNLVEDKVRAEQFRTLRAKLRLLAEQKKIGCLGVVSVARGEGKTTVAGALGLVTAQEPGTRVLLIDADLRKADLEKSLGAKKQPGLAEWLARPTPEIHIRRLAPHGAYFLAAGRSHGRPWELIASPHFARLLGAARQRFDLVVVDCPPLVPVADSALIQKCVDGMLLVVRARTAPRETILSALEQVQEEKIVGMVLNDVRRLVSNFQHFRYQYGKY